MLFTLFAVFTAPVLASDQDKSSNWNQQWQDCKDFGLPLFQIRLEEFRAFALDGEAWDRANAQQRAEMDRLASETCKKWAENPNGDEPLRQFVKEFSAVSKSALDLKEKADRMLFPQLKLRSEQAAAELAPYNYRLENFRCGKAFFRTMKYLQSEIKSIEGRFAALKNKCPKAAENMIADAVANGLVAKPRVYGLGSGNEARQPSSKSGPSDISGTQKAIQDNKKAAPLVR